MSIAQATAQRPGIPSSALAALFVPLWWTGFVTARLVAPHAEPLTFLGLRFVAAGAILALYALWSGASWPQTGRAWFDALVAGLLIHGIYLGGVFWAVSQRPALRYLGPYRRAAAAPHRIAVEATAG